MRNTAYLFSISAEHTTAHYFARAINKMEGWQCIYLDHLFDLSILKPDNIFFYVDPAPAWPFGLENIPCLSVAYLIDVHQHINPRLAIANFFDLIFIAQKDYVQTFMSEGHSHTYWLPLACDEQVHNQAIGIKSNDVGFVGNFGRRDTQRWKILSSILPQYKTNDYQRYHPPLEMANIYGKSKIVFNASVNDDVNMRVFEGMAAGALLVTDRIGNGLCELFMEGVHLVGYDTIDEAQEKINYYLSHDEERQQIAQAGQQEVLAHHTYLKRWNTIVQQICIARKEAPARKMTRKALGVLYAQIFVSLRQPARIGAVCLQYGISAQLIQLWLRSCARWINARVPLTPNAIIARIRK